jgi:hypothetical protein
LTHGPPPIFGVYLSRLQQHRSGWRSTSPAVTITAMLT